VNTRRPFLLVRARAKPERRAEFAAWFRAVHLAEVTLIPGIATVRSGRAPGDTHLGLYSFENVEVLQAALASPEAAKARATWEEWTPHLEELLIEMWAAQIPMAFFQSSN